MARTVILTGGALACFAANSLLCRAALRPRLIDPASFTAVRLASGALVLALLVGAPRRRALLGGSWGSPVALFGYAAAFSLAYDRIGAGPGALLLFGAVQVTMVGWASAHGARPTAAQWAGIVLATAGLGFLTVTSGRAPDLAGSVLMLLAGVAWGAYTLRARGNTEPVVANASHFVRSVPLAAALTVAQRATLHASVPGVALAVASGALASAMGYVAWFAAVPRLGATRAAAVQLSVPVLAGIGAIAFLGEHPTPRLVGAGVAIVAGIGLVIPTSGAR